MNDWFGVWVAMGVFGSTLAGVLAYYGFVEWRREEGSSFFSWDFAWRLCVPELILGGLCFVLGIGFGAAPTDNESLLAFLGLVALLIIVALMLLHYALIMRAHARASRSRRLQGKRIWKTARV